MRPQVTRLIFCFTLLIGGFLALRSQIVPKGFGTEGFHRAEAPDRIMANPLRHAGKAACVECHGDIAEVSPHVLVGVSCETCHGPAQKHAADVESFLPPKPTGRTLCLRCHAKIVARRPDFPQVEDKVHNPGSPCMSCHNIHPTGEQP